MIGVMWSLPLLRPGIHRVVVLLIFCGCSCRHLHKIPVSVLWIGALVTFETSDSGQTRGFRW